MKRYRGIFALTATLVCSLIILGLGYAGIALGSDEILKISQEPEQISMSENISNRFYSRIEDDVQLYPWNYDTEAGGSTEGLPASETLMGIEETLYMLIATAADVEVQEVIRWYGNQEKDILDDVVTRYAETEGRFFYFYNDCIRLNGREYRVKFSADEGYIFSFSCLRTKDERVRDSQQWSENKEQLSEFVGNNERELMVLWNNMEEMRWNIYDIWEWERYVEMYLMLDNSFRQLEKGNELDLWEIYGYENGTLALKVDADEVDAYEEGMEAWYKNMSQDFDLQMVELDDCILLMSGKYQQAVYYDVMEQRVVGFHFFLN